MDGNCQNSKSKIYNYLEKWVIKVINEKSWLRFEDLHVDDIDLEFKNKSNWVNSILIVNDYLKNIINQDEYEILYSIPLKYKKNKTNFLVLNINYLKKNLYLSPPSVYLFPKRDKTILTTLENCIFLEMLSMEFDMKVYYKEIEDKEEYFRVIYLRN